MMKYIGIILLLVVVMDVQAGKADQIDELESLLSVVAEEIAFEPYTGNLRSVDFVEKTKKANALDRSLLLLAKLKAAGFRAHVARGELLEQSKQNIIKNIIDDSEGQLYSLVPNALDQSLATHFWVEVLVDNQLMAMDASFPDATLGQSFAVKKGVLTSLATYQHKFKIVHKLKNKSGRVIELGSYSSTSSLQGIEPISLVTTAEPIMDEVGRNTGFLGGGLSGIAGGVAGSRPGSTSKNASVVGMSYQTNLIVKEGSRKFGNYQSTFNIEGAGFEKEWLEITLTSPGAPPHVVERPLFLAGRKGDAVDYRLVTINVLPGEIPLAFKQAELNLLSSKQNNKSLSSVSTLLQAVSLNNNLGPQAGLMLNLSIAALSDAQTNNMAKRNRILPVYDKPRIYITTLEGKRNSLADAINYKVSFDFRVDDISAYYLQNNMQALSYYFNIARGLQQSALEGLMLDDLQSGGGYSTTDIMLAANEQGIERYVITQEAPDKITSITELSSEAKLYLEEALESGYQIIIPERPVLIGNEPYWAWWQLDPTTGKTEGVLENGLHGATIEYTLIESKIVINDQQGFVLGMLAGANSASMMIISNLLAGNSLDKSNLEAIERKLQMLACKSCLNPDFSLKLSSTVSAKMGCFELYKATRSIVSIKLNSPISFCSAYSAGFNCAVKMALGKISNKPSIDIKDAAVINAKLSCPGKE